ncbi:MAG: hypothetical protein AB7T49_05905 [Oligoflexales bacterium]
MSAAFNLKNGRIFVLTEAPGGLYNSHQLKAIAEICSGEMALVKVTEDQRLGLFVKPEDEKTVSSKLQAIGLGVRHYQNGLHQPVSCIGELCPTFEQDALGSAMELTNALMDIATPAALRVGINGCATCCVPCHTLDIAIVGDPDGYRMSLGGKNSQIPEMASFVAEGVPADQLVGLVRKVVDVYSVNAKEGQSLGELIEEIGMSPFIEVLKPYSQDAAGDTGDLFGSAKDSNQAPTKSDSESAKSENEDLDVGLDVEEGMLPEPTGGDIEALGDELLSEESLSGPTGGIEVLGDDLLSEESLSEDFDFKEDSAPLETSQLQNVDDDGLLDEVSLMDDINVQETANKNEDLDISAMDSPSDQLLSDVPIDDDPMSALLEDETPPPVQKAKTAIPVATLDEFPSDDIITDDLDDALLPQDEMSEEEKLESEISQGIEEDKDILTTTRSELLELDERLDTIEMVEKESLEEAETEIENLEQLGDPEVMEEDPLDSAFDSNELSEAELNSLSQEKVSSEDEFGGDDFSPATFSKPEAAVAKETSAPAATPNHQRTSSPMPVAARSPAGLSTDFNFSEVQFNNQGALVVKFQGGARIEISPNGKEEEKTFSLGSTLVVIRRDQKCCRIDIGEIQLSLPWQKVA